ncbi:hypothetical protein D9M71_275170 [compost metagenome]
MWWLVPARSTCPGCGGSPSRARRTGRPAALLSHSAMPAANTWSTCWTSTMAAGNAAGKPLSNTSSAAGPPAEDPIATNPRRWEASRSGAATALAAGARCWPTSQPILRILRSKGAAASRASPAPSAGVSTTSRAPWPMASNTRCTFCLRSTVTMTMAHGVSAMIRRVASTPSITGMIRSMRIRSGNCSVHRCTASAPLLATHTTWCAGSRATARRNASTARGMSLTMAIFIPEHLRSAPPQHPATHRRGNWPLPNSSRRQRPARAVGLPHGLYRTPPSPATTAGAGRDAPG